LLAKLAFLSPETHIHERPRVFETEPLWQEAKKKKINKRVEKK